MLQPDDRQRIGCGFEPPPVDRKRLSIWDPPRSRVGFSGDPPTTCPGYTTQLPAVHAIVRAHAHWSKGQLETFLGEKPTEQTLLAIEIYDGERSRFENWALTSAEQGGGRGAS